MRRDVSAVARGLVGIAVIALASACGTGGPQGIDVTGRIASGTGGTVPDVKVSVAGRTPITPDANGEFAASGIAIPYDVVVYSLSEGWAHVFEDLESAHPTLVPAASSAPTSSGSIATVDVTIPLAISTGQELVVCADNELVPVASCVTFTDADTPPYQTPVFWEGDDGLEVTIRAVLYDVDADGFATLVAGMGTTTVSLEDQDTVGATVPFGSAPPMAASFGLDVDMPLGWSVTQARAAIVLPSSPNTVVLPSGLPTAFPVSFLGPVIPDATRLAVAIATGPGQEPATAIGWKSDIDAQPQTLTLVDLTLHEAPDLAEPFSGATGVTPGTIFRVADEPDQAHTFVFSPDTVGPSLAVTSLDGTIALPDLSEFSTLLGWPGGAGYSWAVYSGRPFPDAASYADGRGGPRMRATRAFFATAGGFLGDPMGSGTATVTPGRTFVLQP